MAGKDNEDRFCKLAWPHMDAVLRTAQCLAHSSADAEDLAQETMVKAFKAIQTVRDEAKVKSWLMSILRRARMDQVRSEKGDASLEQLHLQPERDDRVVHRNDDEFWRDPQELLNSFGDEEVIRALRELPKDIRWTLLLVDVEGLDQIDASRVLAVPVGTVKSRLHRGRAILRGVLQESRQPMHMAV